MQEATHDYGRGRDAHIELLYAANPLMDKIAQDIRDEFGVDTRPGAEAALAEWPHAAELTDRERTAVLSRFPASHVVDFSFEEAGELAEYLNREHERLCSLNYNGQYTEDIEFIERIVPKLI